MSIWMNVEAANRSEFCREARDAFFFSGAKLLEFLKERRVPIDIRSVVTSDSPMRMFLRGNLKPAHFRYVAEYGILGEETSIQELDSGSIRILHEGVPLFEAAFPKDGVVVVSPIDDGRKGDGETGFKLSDPEAAFNAASEFSIPQEQFVFGLIIENPAGNADFPEMNGVRKLTVGASFDPKKPRPVSARIVAKTGDETRARALYVECSDYFRNLYANASRLGAIPPDLQNAFRPSLNGDELVIDVSLREDHAVLLFKTWRAKLSGILTPILSKELETLQ